MENFLEVAEHGESILHREGWGEPSAMRLTLEALRAVRPDGSVGRPCGCGESATAGWPGRVQVQAGSTLC